eukprot:Gregarina_sp_Pseudo_9__5570@NODE_748_length_2273_cov_55_470904_g704_i0_p2_GENE_NODE_748_length_2273_cov_55_470904_g704_i0NODE_748_length_2273_cov_55_470904_g704_i0_p2_ORF_typecomplete_len218_score7_88UPF0016/PF01169_19/4_9e12DPM3/PF08285_11/0_2_NODE_748_length_2273_cov_55_470904_g704_i048701
MVGSGRFWGVLLTSFASTAISEVGDRSFFTATILSIRYPRLVTFLATYSALLVQSLTSATFGTFVQAVVPQKTTFPVIPAACALLFGVFAFLYLLQAVSQYKANLKRRRSHAHNQALPQQEEQPAPQSLGESRRESWAAELVERENKTDADIRCLEECLLNEETTTDDGISKECNKVRRLRQISCTRQICSLRPGTPDSGESFVWCTWLKSETPRWW